MAKQSEGAQLKEDTSSPTMNDPDASRDLALQVAEAALDKKASRIEIIDVRGKVDYTDYVVVMSGRSDRQVAAIARGIEETLKKDHGQRCSGVEGLPQGNWVWLDADRVEFEGQQAEEGFVFP